MPQHIVFISMFLGLASGLQPIELQTDATVKSIRITLAGREAAHLAQPPWRTEIDLGLELVPREVQRVAERTPRRHAHMSRSCTEPSRLGRRSTESSHTPWSGEQPTISALPRNC